MVSRVGMRQLLMRDQLQQEEQRERQRHLPHMQQRPPGPPAPSPAINAPLHFPEPMQVPVEVLKVSNSDGYVRTNSLPLLLHCLWGYTVFLL